MPLLLNDMAIFPFRSTAISPPLPSFSFNSSKIARIQSAGRIERAEGDKQSEFFNLVIKNTIEEKWFAKAMAGIDFITINEDQLQDILNNKEIRVKKNKDVDLSYLI